MKRILRSVRAVDLRLALAVAACVVLFVATPTTPTDSSSCAVNGDYGSVAFTNNSLTYVELRISGPSSQMDYVTIQSFGTRSFNRVRTGIYWWIALRYADPLYDWITLTTTGTVTVKKDQTVRVAIAFKD